MKRSDITEPTTPTRRDDIVIVNYGRKNWRTVVRDACDSWDITGPPYATKIEAMSVIPQIERDYFGEV